MFAFIKFEHKHKSKVNFVITLFFKVVTIDTWFIWLYHIIYGLPQFSIKKKQTVCKENISHKAPPKVYSNLNRAARLTIFIATVEPFCGVFLLFSVAPSESPLISLSISSNSSSPCMLTASKSTLFALQNYIKTMLNMYKLLFIYNITN